MGDLREFDDLPEMVWRSNGGQLVKNINDFMNGKTAEFQKLSVLSSWDRELKSDQKFLKSGLGLMLKKDPDGERLVALLESGDVAGLGEALKTSSYKDDRWMTDEFAKLVKSEKALSALAGINNALRDYVTWNIAANRVWTTAKVSGDHKKMELPLLGEGVPRWPDDLGGDKIIYGKTCAATLATTQQTLRRVADAVKALPDDVLEVFLSRSNFKRQAADEFRGEVAALASAPQAKAIEMYSNRYMQETSIV